MRGSGAFVPRSILPITRPRAETSQESSPCRTTATARSGTTTTERVRKARSSVADKTVGSLDLRSARAASSCRRLVPSSLCSAVRPAEQSRAECR